MDVERELRRMQVELQRVQRQLDAMTTGAVFRVNKERTIIDGTLTAAPGGSTVLSVGAAGLDVTGALTVTDTLTLSSDTSLSGRQFSLDDDTVLSFDPPNDVGFMLVYQRNNWGNGSGLIAYRATSLPYCYGTALGTNMVVDTGALTNGTTDGVDARVNVHTHTDSKIYIKNRMGSTTLLGVVFLGN